MEIVGKSIILPLIDSNLNHSDSIELIPGVHVTRLGPQYREHLQKDKVLIGGYQRSLERMFVGLSLEPSIAYKKRQLSLAESLLMAIFVTFTLRLATEVTIDIPFWLDLSTDGLILGCGRTLVRTYRTSPPYTYPLDEGRTHDHIELLRPHLSSLLHRYLENPDTDRVIKALEFASVGFQTLHVPTRIVNQVTFMEVLFSSEVQELSFQLASRISWYLRHSHSHAEREDIFEAVKGIYRMRSEIVHGASGKNLRALMRQRLKQSEFVNSEIFREMLAHNHIDLFSAKNRKEHLRKLSLGLPCDFFKKC